MSDRCSSCGQPFAAHDHDAHDEHGVLLPAPGERDAPTARPRKQLDRRVLIALAAAIGVWLLFVVGARLVAPDEKAEVPYAPTATPVPTAAPVPSVTAVPTVIVTEDQIVSTSEDVIRRVISTAGQGDRLARQLERRDLELSVAWRVGNGQVAVTDLRTETAAQVHLTVPVELESAEVLDDRILRSGPSTLFVGDGFVVGLGEDSALLASDPAGDGIWYVAPESLDGQAAEVSWVHSFQPEGIQTFSSPHAHQLEAIDGLGLVAWNKGPGGGWQVANGSTFRPAGTGQMLSANAVAAVVRPCERSEACSVEVRRHDGTDVWAVPDGFVGIGDRLVLSPDARHLMRIDRTGLAEVYSTDDGSVLWVIGRGMEHAVWTPDSTAILWLDQIGQAELKAMFIDEKLWISVPLPALEAPKPVTTELIVFETSFDPRPITEPERECELSVEEVSECLAELDAE